MISNIEQGLINATLSTLELLAGGLDCTAAELISECIGPASADAAGAAE